MKYEIEMVAFPDHYCESFIASLTGHDLQEILVAADGVKVWRGREWIRTFRALGFNCNPRFKAFDPETPYPTLLRTKDPEDKKYWHPYIYNDGKIYHIHWDQEGITIDQWIKLNPGWRITSMLQVWI